MINVKNKKLLKAFGENLRNIRKAKELSQEALANMADIPISQVGRIERGEVNTTISTVFALAEALEIEALELIKVKV